MCRPADSTAADAKPKNIKRTTTAAPSSASNDPQPKAKARGKAKAKPNPVPAAAKAKAKPKAKAKRTPAAAALLHPPAGAVEAPSNPEAPAPNPTTALSSCSIMVVPHEAEAPQPVATVSDAGVVETGPAGDSNMGAQTTRKRQKREDWGIEIPTFERHVVTCTHFEI